MEINLDKIIRSRAGKRGKWIPRQATRMLERIVHQDELNATLRATYPSKGTEFANRVYDYFDLTLEIEGADRIPKEGRFIFASNHPLGGLDGIGLIKALGGIYGDDGIRFLVNDMLMNVEPLRCVFLPVNKFGAQGREASRLISEAYNSERQIIIFPAGLVSRLHSDGKIRDLTWQKSFVLKALSSGRDIIPVRFEGENRKRFYRLARLRKRLGIKLNLEQSMLPAELCASRGKHFRIKIGEPITHAEIEKLRAEGHTPGEIAAMIKEKTYSL